MSDAPPLLMQYDGEVMRPPDSRWEKLWVRHFAIGETYLMVEHNDRSANSHRHYFAVLYQMWESLPEQYADAPWATTSEHLRKYALIRTGHYNSTSLVCASKAEAQRVAAFMRPVDEFSVVIAKESVVTRYTACSQSMKAMGNDVFQQSKTKVLDFVEDLIGGRL